MNISVVVLLLLIMMCSSVDGIRWFKLKSLFRRSQSASKSSSSCASPVSVSKTSQDKILMLRGGMQVFVKTLTG